MATFFHSLENINNKKTSENDKTPKKISQSIFQKVGSITEGVASVELNTSGGALSLMHGRSNGVVCRQSSNEHSADGV